MEGITAGTSAEQPPELVIHSETPAPPAAPIDWGAHQEHQEGSAAFGGAAMKR